MNISANTNWNARILPRIVGVIVLFLVGCASVPRDSNIILPSARGEGWHLYRSEHLDVYSNLPERIARENVREFERRHALLLDMMFQGRAAPLSRTRVVVFEDESQYRWFFRESRAVFMSNQNYMLGRNPTIVTYGRPGDRAFEVMLHELTHRFLGHALGPMPTWLNEGMAQYYSTVDLDHGRAVLGQPLSTVAFVMGGTWHASTEDGEIKIHVPTTQVVPPSKLVSLEPEDFYVARSKRETDLEARKQYVIHYASSWAFVHMLLSGNSVFADAFNEALAEAAEGADVGERLEAKLEEIGWSVVDDAFFAHLARRETQLWRRPFAAPEPSEASVEALSDAKVLALYAQLGGTPASRVPRTSDQLLDMALATDAKESSAQLMHAMRLFADDDPQAARVAVERAVEYGDQNDALVWRVSVLLHSIDAEDSTAAPSDELRISLARLEKSANAADDFNALAWQYAHLDGELDKASKYARESVRRDPACWQCWDTCAFVETRRGNWDDAVALQRIALAWMDENVAPGARRRARRQLEDYEEALASKRGGDSESE